MSDEPQRPHPSREVEAWIDRHVPIGMSLEVVTDAPPAVMAWIARLTQWRADRAVWASQQPIDYAPERGPRGCWRMFGGEWIPESEHVDATDGDMRSVVHLLSAAQDALLTMSAESFRAWALTFYEHRRMIGHAKVGLVRHMRGRDA